MEVFVQGTKGGYKILYPNQAPDVFYSFAKDVRRSDGNGAIGWNIYAVTLLGNGCIFSKYVGLYDELRNYGGYIAFSAFIPLSKKMAGSNVKAMLDEMSDRYCKVYAPYGKITRDPENWAFINEIASRYEGMLQTVSSYNGTSGQINADKSAYLFYSDDAELVKYFDNPYQEEYRNYRQVFLVDALYETKTNNPLNVVNHDANANLTGKIDLEKITYRIYDFYGTGKLGTKIELWANERPLHNEALISNNDIIRIRYSRANHIPVEETGFITDGNIANLLVVGANSIKIKTDLPLIPNTKKIYLDARDEKGEIVPDSCIKCINTRWEGEKHVINGAVLFSGDELGESWTIDVKKGNLSASKVIVPQEQSAALKITLQSKPAPASTKPSDKKQYKIEVDENKGISPERWTTSGKPTFECEARRGYVFIGWNLIPLKVGDFDGTYEAQFKEKWWHKKTILVIVLLLVLIGGGTGILLWLAPWDDDEKEYTSEEKTKIIDRINGYLSDSSKWNVDSIVTWHNEIENLNPGDSDTIYKPRYDSLKKEIDSIYDKKLTEYRTTLDIKIEEADKLKYDPIKYLAYTLKNDPLCDSASKRKIDSVLLKCYLRIGYGKNQNNETVDYLDTIFAQNINVKAFSTALDSELEKLRNDNKKRQEVGERLKSKVSKDHSFDQIAEIIKNPDGANSAQEKKGEQQQSSSDGEEQNEASNGEALQLPSFDATKDFWNLIIDIKSCENANCVSGKIRTIKSNLNQRLPTSVPEEYRNVTNDLLNNYKTVNRNKGEIIDSWSRSDDIKSLREKVLNQNN